jgi:hypothetical protein
MNQYNATRSYPCLSTTGHEATTYWDQQARHVKVDEIGCGSRYTQTGLLHNTQEQLLLRMTVIGPNERTLSVSY